MKITTQSVTLLRASHEAFKGTDGKDVEYDKAVLLDDEGNKFEMSVHKDAAEAVFKLGEKVDGIAEIETFIAQKGGSAAIKMRLLGFKAGKAT